MRSGCKSEIGLFGILECIHMFADVGKKWTFLRVIEIWKSKRLLYAMNIGCNCEMVLFSDLERNSTTINRIDVEKPSPYT